MILGMISGTILAYLVPVPVLDLTDLIEVLWTCLLYCSFHSFGVTIWIRDISSIQLTVRTCAHWALVDITQQCSSHLRAIHDKCMIKCAGAAHFIICKTKINIPGAQVIYVLNDMIHGSMVQLQTPVPNPFCVCFGAYWPLEDRKDCQRTPCICLWHYRPVVVETSDCKRTKLT